MSLLFSPDPFFFPELSLHVQTFMRMSYGFLQFGTLVLALPHGMRFFISERWGGYAQSSADVDALHNPKIYPLVMGLWILSALLLAIGVWSPWSALVNLLFCRYFFIHMRWKGLLRGMGAPGYVTYWAGAAIFFLEYTLHYAPELRPLTLLVFQADFAFIYLSSGFYKFSSGYPQNHGMELGMVNPAWGYWWKTYKNFPPSHSLFKTLNHLAWSSQIVAALLMLFPATRFIGGVIIIGMFIFVGSQIRLALLCETVVLCSGLLFFHPGSLGDQAISLVVADATAPQVLSTTLISGFNQFLELSLWGYLLLLPIAHFGLSYNFYLRRRFPNFLQGCLERYTNFFGLIVWRVFSVDLVNFFIRIYIQPKTGNRSRRVVTLFGSQGKFRYDHVAESITLACLFNTLKYYPSNNELFRERMRRYSKTIPCPPTSNVVFEYMSIVKTSEKFEFLPVVEFMVDVPAGTIEEHKINDLVSVRAPDPASPVHEGTGPGSYAPLKA